MVYRQTEQAKKQQAEAQAKYERNLFEYYRDLFTFQLQLGRRRLSTLCFNPEGHENLYAQLRKYFGQTGVEVTIQLGEGDEQKRLYFTFDQPKKDKHVTWFTFEEIDKIVDDEESTE